MLLSSAFLHAQTVKRYNFGKPATVESYIKEVITWENGKKIGAESFAGDKMEIFMSDSLIRITEKSGIQEYVITEVRIDDFGNATFFNGDENVLRWFRHRRVFQLEPANSTVEVIYYVD
jgi:hypothetical protein